MKLMIQSYAGSPSLNSAVIEYSVFKRDISQRRQRGRIEHARSLNLSMIHWTKRLANSTSMPNTNSLIPFSPKPPPPTPVNTEANIESPNMRVMVDEKSNNPPPEAAAGGPMPRFPCPKPTFMRLRSVLADVYERSG